MTLKELFSIFGKIEWRGTSPDQVVLGVHADSRKISKDMVFVAVQGVSSNGHDYIRTAVDQGACALVVESSDNIPEDYEGAILQVLDSKIALSELLSIYYSEPEDRMIAIGITGTNGKTSSSYVLEAFLNEAQVPCGVMGTIDHHFRDKIWKSSLTTPDTVTFFERLRDFTALGAKAFVMEVSSHSLKQDRVPVPFDVAIFTNFTRDHLDYHYTMEDYLHCNEKLFTTQLKKTKNIFAILNTDDPQVEKTHIAKHASRFTIGQKGSPDFLFQIKKISLAGMDFTIREKNTENSYSTVMVGAHNVYNIVGAVAAARALGIPHAICQRALQKFNGIPGRLQRVPNTSGRHAFVDYAHTPDALEKVLQTLRELTAAGGSRLITVFGCGGDRDAGKRPLMGATAGKLSDIVVVTSDNPRGEDPQAIINDILPGLKDHAQVHAVVDREGALRKAVELSKPNDVIVVAGKGHEDYQILGDKTLSFSDFEKMRNFLAKAGPA